MARFTKDSVAKLLMGRADIFASAFNYYLYAGRRVIKPEELTELSVEELEAIRNEKGRYVQGK